MPVDKRSKGPAMMDRRTALKAVRRVIRDNLPDGYEEVMTWGTITYRIDWK